MRFKVYNSSTTLDLLAVIKQKQLQVLELTGKCLHMWPDFTWLELNGCKPHDLGCVTGVSSLDLIPTSDRWNDNTQAVIQA